MSSSSCAGRRRLRLPLERGRGGGEYLPSRVALLETGRRAGVSGRGVGKVEFRAGRLFRAPLDFPANVPIGTYLVEVFLIRNKGIVSGQTTPLVISKIGIDAEIYNFADRWGALYGLVAVATAMMAGWLASLPFRNA